MWGKESNPYLQCLHAFWALGSALSPLIAAPFLASGNQYPNFITIPFTIGGLILFASSVTAFYFELFTPYKTRNRSLEAKVEIPEILVNNESNEKGVEIRKKLRFYNLACILLGSLLLCFYCGSEYNIFSYLPTFLIELPLKISKQTTAMMSATFGAMFTLFRFISILVATKVQTSTMLYISLADLILAYLLLLFAHESVVAIWISIVFIGIGCSSVFASIYAFIEQRINITNVIASIFMMSCAIISIVWPIIIGNHVDRNPMIFVNGKIYPGLTPLKWRHWIKFCQTYFAY
ncbi:sodium-dependent glucose transporter 1-like protein [Leptotrombidium deliense]|uniref:Sodium-dependent glucose transporter 1-like protein n=1 Tax=Leptotrombidium deliense TaxID=299467 RepID=A0A443SBI5_9ACAR|nr:sodium-dependent glucose transporter 1-like protein [Leptotrombidium deliense]